ncbi:MAG: MFS transporter [Actinomycetaceae bacterium]|nr:MFS transporter [Arcanobacterium sp.]MDD7504919.1 MFS transporter [Actinomycetaceae bacterium]MDY6143265.1 MFS transporter [Arcanobacterium sp.]
MNRSAHVDENEAQFKAAHPAEFKQYVKRHWVVFVVAYFGYVCAYLVRNNFKLTSETIRLENDWSLTQVGLILTGFTISYGIGKFLMGMVVDNMSLRKTFAGALAGSAVICILMGFTTQIWIFFGLMLLLGTIQGVLSPGSQSMIANWFPNKTRGAGIAVWNTSQNLGGALLPLMVGGFAGAGLPIQYSFWVPAVMVLLLSFVFWKFGGDRPEEEGLPTLRDIYGHHGVPMADEKPEGTFWQIMVKYVFTNRLLLTIGFINAILYFLRFGVENWMPAFLGTELGFTEVQYTTAFSVLEWVAIPGSFFFAWVAIKLPNRQSLVGGIGLIALAGLVLVYHQNTNYGLLLVVSGIMGALIYGPQLIINILTLNFVPLKAAGTAVGFVGLFGYIVGELAANLIMPILAEQFSWTVSFIFLTATALIAALLYFSLSKQEKKVVDA